MKTKYKPLTGLPLWLTTTLSHTKRFLLIQTSNCKVDRDHQEQLRVLICLYQVIGTTSEVMTGGRMIQQSNTGEAIVHSQLLCVTTANAWAM